MLSDIQLASIGSENIKGSSWSEAVRDASYPADS